MKKSFYHILPLAVCTFGMSFMTHAQIVEGVSYLKGKWVQTAISDCGTYTSGADGVIKLAPETYNENTFDGSLSFTNDVTLDGWDVGVPDQCGDYIMPGTPEEGFALQIGPDIYANIQPYCYRYGVFFPDAPAFLGSNTANINGGTIRKSVWQGTNPDLGLAVAQTTYWVNKKQSFITIVDLCNGGEDLFDVYYGRNADPDNDNIATGIFNTSNDVKKQILTGGYSQVVASSVTGSPCYMAYVSGDPRSKASRGNFSMGSPYDMWNAAGGYVQTTGALNADQAIQISFKIDTLLSNDCGCFTYSTMFSPAGLAEQVSLTNTACATLGTLARYGEDMVAEYLTDPEYFLENTMIAYPNPSNGNFTVNLFEMEDAQIIVTNAVGDVVYTVNQASKFVGITMDDAPAGLYFVNAYYGDGKVITKSIVIE